MYFNSSHDFLTLSANGFVNLSAMCAFKLVLRQVVNKLYDLK